MLSRFVALEAGTAAVISGVVTVLAGSDPVAFGLHAIERSALALLGGGVASAYRFAQRQDERGSVAGGGVPILPSQDPVDGRLLRGRGGLRRPAVGALHRRIGSFGSRIAFFGSPVTSLRRAVPAQSLTKQLVDVRALRAAAAVTVVSCRVAGVGHAVAADSDVSRTSAATSRESASRSRSVTALTRPSDNCNNPQPHGRR